MFNGDKPKSNSNYNDSGSASRFFYCAKASKKDRDSGMGCDKNTHPTVKPCQLMQYLVRLVTPKGGTVLDPFMGSGSTGKACMYENKERSANYYFIGVDLSDEYLFISDKRIKWAMEYSDIEDTKIEEEKKDKVNLW